MSERIVHCSKLQTEAPGLAKPPFAGPLGQEIFERVSQAAWDQWQNDVMIKIINEYRLNLADAEQYQILLQQMRSFFNLGAEPLLEVENAKRGREG